MFGNSCESAHLIGSPSVGYKNVIYILSNFFIADEEFLVHCLLRSKTSMEKAKFTLNRYFSLKTAMPDIYDNRDPTNPNLILCSKVM